MKKISLIVSLFMVVAQVAFAQSSGKDQAQTNKKLVVTFYQKLFGDKDISVIDQYIAADYIQHNPTVADGREALKEVAAKWLANQPKSKVDFQHVAADNDLVFLHIKTQSPSGKYASLVDIFRVKNGKIVEHWDTMQEVPDKSANAHPMF